jgi:dTDP-4-dehydrorhamnose reductase
VDLSTRGDFTRSLGSLKVDSVIHTAALVSPDLCEKDPDLAHAINVDGTREVAVWAEKQGATMIYFSTDLVFDGNKGWYQEADTPAPLNVYGRTKLQGEQQVSRVCTSWFVLRLALSYGPTRGARGDWTLEMRSQIREGKDLRLFTDQFRTPAYVGDTAEVVLRLVSRKGAEIFHMGGGERVSRYAFGMKFFRIFNLPEQRIVPLQMEEVPMAARRAPDCSLSTKKIAETLGLVPCGVDEGLRRQKREEEGFGAKA